MREREFQSRVEDMLDSFGWKWRHVPAPMRWDSIRKTFVPAAEAAGLCDIIATYHDPPRLVFIELKGDRGKLSEAQRDFLASVKLVADDALAYDHYRENGEARRGYDLKPCVGVYAFWPKDEAVVEQLLRSKVLS